MSQGMYFYDDDFFFAASIFSHSVYATCMLTRVRSQALRVFQWRL